MAKEFKYYVVTTVYDDFRAVKVRAAILTPEEAANLGYYHGYTSHSNRADKYVDGYFTEKAAKQAMQEIKQENGGK